MKKLLFGMMLLAVSFSSVAQDEGEERKGGFKKENLFVGGDLTLGFSNIYTAIGISPYFGYSLNKYIDVAAFFNFNDIAQRDYAEYRDRVRQTIYGPGAFVRVYPFKFVFAQAQFEHNFVKARYIPANNSVIYLPSTDHVDANSFLVGAGYAGFKTFEEIQQHIHAGAKKVILSAPSEVEEIKTIVLGVNEFTLNGTETIVSNASCTTNNAAPMIKVIDELCGIEQAYITTVHSYTTDQSLHDQPHKDLRRARGATQSIVPTTTGAAKALTKIFPKLDTKLGRCGIRVPVPDGSLTDITCNVSKSISIEEINLAFKTASQTY